MKSPTKRRSAHRTRQQLAHCSPVGVAVSRRLLPSEQLELHISMFDLAHGAPCAERLASLAYTLAVGASIEADARLGSPDCKQMHAALRTVLAMCAAGNRWDSAQAPVLYAADKKAEALLLANPIQPKDLADRCEALASRVRAGVATLAEVAGPEIYAAAAAEGKKCT